ncbi:hypothetical protein G7050_17015 [Dysgonomonas sp. HDW5A]|uniref:energy transducer TonB n=1 Tax=Dysgonomonas sp. HDW5A TaxID=2714926 RepID=UPI00140AB3B4|nr:energy transducer TonB [Dysgonomonas sp. HDW5A]QIK61452.1 hypothetical protein G7050_17015 [Dysgonomonas sp. HDW5A]
MEKFIYITLFSFIFINLNAQISILNKEIVSETKKDTLSIYTSAEVMPQFPGGDVEMMKYIGRNLRYPSSDLSELIDNGRINVRFVVRKTGKIDNITMRTPLAKAFEAEVVRFMQNMPKWIPGKMNGENVDCYYTLPILIHFQTK